MNWPGGNRAAPFVWFNTAPTQANPDWLNDPRLRRMNAFVKKSAELIMVVEAPNPNWYDQTASTVKDGEIVWLRRLGARHGKKSRAGLNADTNIAFFDGHVAKFNTAPLAVRKDGTGDQLDLLTQETIFFLNKQGQK